MAAARVLTIAGSDSGGGAGIQADLTTIAALGGFGMSVVTALTAQNTLGVADIHEVPPDFVAKQFDAVAADIGIDAANGESRLLSTCPRVPNQGGANDRARIRRNERPCPSGAAGDWRADGVSATRRAACVWRVFPARLAPTEVSHVYRPSSPFRGCGTCGRRMPDPIPLRHHQVPERVPGGRAGQAARRCRSPAVHPEPWAGRSDRRILRARSRGHDGHHGRRLNRLFDPERAGGGKRAPGNRTSPRSQRGQTRRGDGQHLQRTRPGQVAPGFLGGFTGLDAGLGLARTDTGDIYVGGLTGHRTSPV